MRLTVLALALLFALGGCSGSRPPLRLRRIQVPAVGADQRCGDPANEATTDLPAGTYTLRLSFLRGSGSTASDLTVGRYDLICDATAPQGEVARELLVPQAELVRGGVVLRVEAFDSEDQHLVYSGQTRLDEVIDDEVSVYLQRAGSQSCFFGQRRPRAFHSATLLPNGQVLLAGGLTGSPGAAATIDGGLLYAEDSVEVFDPTDLSARLVVATTKMPPRAFHRAVLLTSPRTGPYRVLLLGGMTSPTGSEAVAHLLSALDRDPFLISPEASATAAPSGILTYFPAARGEDGRFDYAELPAPAAGFFPELALSGDGTTLLAIGGPTVFSAGSGADAGFAAPAGPQAQWWALPAPTAPGDSLPELTETVPLARLRAGHAAARLPEGKFLVLGGAMDGSDAEAESALTEVAPLRQRFDAAGLAGVALGTAWQTLTEIGITDEERQQSKSPRALLWTGGFALEPRAVDAARWRATRAPSATALQLLRSVSGGLASSGPLDPQGGMAPAGYHSALRLHDGSVLISGGNANPATCERPDGIATQTAFCPLAQLATYQLDAAGTGLERVTRAGAGALQLARYGHQATRLLDLSVLFSGGLTLNAEAQPAVSAAAELLNVRNGAPSEDYLVNLATGRAPAGIAIPCGRRGGR
ncbi:MAG: hypothetical protein IPL40_15985 [Proteobacteria bacterium]|nr:hypothetical protein [Pseudomonadota bacterium]